jgi:hypothetical protein
MKQIVSIGAVAILLFAVGSANAALWTDGVNTPYNSADVDIEGQFNDHDDWGDGGSFYVIQSSSSTPANWKFAQQDWNGGNNYLIQPDTTNKTEGDASMQVTPHETANYEDIFVGVVISGLAPNTNYDFSFDFQADAGILGYAGGHENDTLPGAAAGDDHTTSAAWQLRNTVENTLEDLGYGIDNPQAWGDTEDYPGHLRGSNWIGDAGMWDGNWYTQSANFTTEGAGNTDVAFVLKFRSCDHSGNSGASFRIDNLQVTPEPASLALVALGGLVMLRRRR